jgi:ADP-heptose:LPS heptosyltransferase
MPLMDKIPDVRKIAILKATALGDYLAATPALYALRETYPDAQITLLGRPFHAKLLEGRPSPIDRVIVIPISHGVRVEPENPDLPEDKAQLESFFERMRAERFDLALQVHGGGSNSNPFIKKLGARVTAGLKTVEAPELDRWTPYQTYQNEYIRLLEVVKLVGVQPCSYDMRFDITERDEAELASKLPQVQAPFAVLHPGASDLRRRWPPDRFAQVGNALAERGYQVVVTGVGYERDLVRHVIDMMSVPAVNACEALSVGGLAAMLARASVVICNDTGPLHLAEAVGTPNVGIFWCGNYLNWSHFSRAHHRPLPSWTRYCPNCGVDMILFDPPRDVCAHDVSFVAEVQTEDVLNAALELLNYAARFGKKDYIQVGV